MSKTTNYQLTVWDYGDEDFTPGQVREDLAENFTALDRVLKAEELARSNGLAEKAKIVTGSYSGNGETQRKVSLGFTPKAVFVCTSEGRVATVSSSLRVQGGLVLPGHPLMVKEQTAMEIVNGGFMAFQRDYLQGVNENTYTYYYWALQ